MLKAENLVPMCCLKKGRYNVFQKALHRVRFKVEAEPEFYMLLLMVLAQTGQWNKFSPERELKQFLTGQSLVKVPVPVADKMTQQKLLSVIESRPIRMRKH